MEYIDVVNERDDVISRTSHDDIYKYKLTHRIVHVLIFNDEGKMAIQLRSAQKSYMPLHWSTAVGGHVQSGENYLEAAKREAQEEIGIESDLELLFKDYYIGEQKINKFLAIYKTIYNGPFELNSEEVDKVEFFTIEEIKGMVKKGDKFHPELLFILDKYFKK